MSVEKVSKIYQEAYLKHGYSLNAIFIPKGRQKERFEVLTQQINPKKKFSILDYGCGLGHLKQYLDNNFHDFHYTGADIVSEFIEENKKRYENAVFKKITTYQEIGENYDFIVLAGVFNILYQETLAEQQKIVRETLIHLFNQTNDVLSVDFMTDEVDFQQPTAYHQNPIEIYKFATQNLSKRVILNQSYMPYEFTIHIFKDDTIMRPDNIYQPL